MGDPAAIRRQIEELDAAFTALQAVIGERFAVIEKSLVDATIAHEAAKSDSRRLGALLTVGVIVAVIAATVLEILVT